MVLKDGKPWSECLIEIRPHPPHVDRTRPQVDFILSDHTNETGAFSVARIRPGLVGVYCAPPGSMYGPGPSSHCTILSLAPEQNVRLEYGRGQRNVVGRLALAEGVEDTVVSWSTAGGSVTPKLDISVPEPERPESSVQMSRKEQLAWLATPEGKAYTDAYRKHRQATVEAAARSGLPFCRFQVAEDGTFEVPYLPPGSYTLRASARLGRQDAGWQAKPQYAHVIHEFTVADVPVREVGAPLDLGTLLLDKEK
jgi:hypothetical protein